MDTDWKPKVIRKEVKVHRSLGKFDWFHTGFSLVHGQKVLYPIQLQRKF